MAAKRTMTDDLADVMADAAKGQDEPTAAALVAAKATGLRRAVWATLPEEEQARLIRVAVRRAEENMYVG